MSKKRGSYPNAPFPYDASVFENGVDKGHLWVDIANRLYAAWTDEEDRFIRLRFADDGATLGWFPSAFPHTISDVPGRSASEDRGINIQAGPGGKVYATWMKRPPGVPAPPGDDLGFARSINQGVTWPTKAYITQVIDGGVTKVLNVRELKLAQIGSGKTMPVFSYPSMTVNQDTLYLVWTNRGSPVGPVGDPDVYLIRSYDAGDNWHGPFRVNQDAGLADQWFPWVTWDSATRSLIVVFYDSRHAANGAEPTQPYPGTMGKPDRGPRSGSVPEDPAAARRTRRISVEPATTTLESMPEVGSPTRFGRMTVIGPPAIHPPNHSRQPMGRGRTSSTPLHSSLVAYCKALSTTTVRGIASQGSRSSSSLCPGRPWWSETRHGSRSIRRVLLAKGPPRTSRK